MDWKEEKPGNMAAAGRAGIRMRMEEIAMAVDLSESREKIDAIDRQIAALFEERMKVAGEVAAYKIKTGKPVLDPEREQAKLSAVEAMVEGEFNRTGIRELYSQIMAISRKYQYSLLAEKDGSGAGKEFCEIRPAEWKEKFRGGKKHPVAFFGVKGTYTEQAMEEFFGNGIKGISRPTFRGVMQAVKDGTAEYGVLPIENSSTGSISDIYDLLLEYDNRIIGEHVVKIDHVLMAVPGTELADITDVYSHGQPLMQCRTYLNAHPEWKLHEEGSTAGCAQKVRDEGKCSQAAIASKRAAAYYGLSVLAEDISMEEGNSTRFIIIAGEPVCLEPADKISICFEAPHVSGSLYNVLSHFIYNNLNMTNIESRPIAGKRWEYRFFLDFEGRLADAAVRNALAGIRAEATAFRILGSYVSAGCGISDG